MENVKIATICGLCAGCKMAINLAKTVNKNSKTTIFKEIVHNKNVNNSLKQLGISFVENFEDIDTSSTVVIRAHGEPPSTYEYFEKNNIKFKDGTCPNVKAIHKLVEEFSKNGYLVAIVGKYGKFNNVCHPEMLGTIKYCISEPILIEDFEDSNKLVNVKNSNVFLICQTTYNPDKFEIIKNNISNICQKNNNQLIIKNTICNAQKSIQKSSLELAKTCDFMIVVGGKNSSNTLELFNNVSKLTKSIHIENINDWKSEFDKLNYIITKNSTIGLTAGASTDKEELLELKSIIENYINTL